MELSLRAQNLAIFFSLKRACSLKRFIHFAKIFSKYLFVRLAFRPPFHNGHCQNVEGKAIITRKLIVDM